MRQRSAVGMVVLMLVGVGMAVGAGAWYLSNRAFARKGMRAEGTVIAVLKGHRYSRRQWRTTYTPSIQFETAQGQSVIFQGPSGSSGHRVGGKVRVLYDPDEPTKAKIDTFAALWLGPIILGGMGVVFAIIAGLSLRNLKKANAVDREHYDAGDLDEDDC